MSRMMCGVVVVACLAWAAVPAGAQLSVMSQAPAGSQAPANSQPPARDQMPTPSPWDVSLDARIGMPTGHIKVGENNVPGTRLSLRGDFGILVSEALEASIGFHFTPRDAIRLSYLYYFLDGGQRLDRTAAYNGETFGPNHVHANLDFQRVTLAYERLLGTIPGGYLLGSAGLTYVYFDPKLTGQGHKSDEDFYRQELPVPILGLGFGVPLGPRGTALVSVSGGGLPRVDSGRKEGGTVFLQQIHADALIGLTYTLTRRLELNGGYYFTYFFQHEKSHEDNNRFELTDNGVRFGLTLRF